MWARDRRAGRHSLQKGHRVGGMLASMSHWKGVGIGEFSSDYRWAGSEGRLLMHPMRGPG